MLSVPQTDHTKPLLIWTTGHSTRPIEEFLELLRTYGITMLSDVRKIPFSRRNPQFNQEALVESLEDSAIQYRHHPALGGKRKSLPDSINMGWRNASFRGYADYMQTPSFWNALDSLIEDGQQCRVAIMCAEAVPWRCHRTLIADAMGSRGWTVQHILSLKSLQTHTLTPFAQLDEGRLNYPAENSQDDSSNHTLPLF